MTSTQASNIKIDRPASILTITWADGHMSAYPLSGIRAACPCVECRGGHENMGGPPDRPAIHRIPAGSWEVKSAQKIGNYALQFTWADGHDAGIFTWRDLRGLCPCAECEADHGK